MFTGEKGEGTTASTIEALIERFGDVAAFEAYLAARTEPFEMGAPCLLSETCPLARYGLSLGAERVSVDFQTTEIVIKGVIYEGVGNKSWQEMFVHEFDQMRDGARIVAVEAARGALRFAKEVARDRE